MVLVLPGQPSHDEDSVRHLVELGYVDPDVLTARESALRRELEAEFQLALKPFERGELADAAGRFEKLATDDPDWIAPRQLLAEVYYRLGNLTHAKEQLDWLTLHAVEHPRLALISGAIALSRRDLPEAFEALKFAAHVEPELPSVHTLLGTALFRMGRSTEAEQALRRAITQRPSDAHALDGLAAVHLRESNFEEAANTSLEALEHDMHLFRAHYHLGVALAHVNLPTEAITALETSAKLNPHSAAPYFWLARIADRQLASSDLARRYRNKGREVLVRRRHEAQLL